MGKTLIKWRALQLAKAQGIPPKTYYDIDYLLAVHDESRMGALRFKTVLDGDFLDHSQFMPTPPWSSIGDLQEAAK